MTKEELKQEAVEYAEKINLQNVNISGVVRNHISQAYLAGAEPREKRIAELEKQHDIVRNERNLFQERCEDILENYYCDHKCKCAELEAQIEKLIDFVLSKTECCDVCPMTDTCINSEGTCPYAGILSKGEEAVTREWLMQKIAKEIKENG